MAARENEIGRCRCPVCSHDKAHLRVNQKQLAYVICNRCNTQVQARSDMSDELLRKLHIAEAPPQPAPQPAPAAPPTHVRTEPPPEPVRADPPKPAPKPAPSWGAAAWMTK